MLWPEHPTPIAYYFLLSAPFQEQAEELKLLKEQDSRGTQHADTKWATDLVLGQWRLGLAIRSLALVLAVIAPYGGATCRGSHTRHRADLCNLVCLCG